MAAAAAGDFPTREERARVEVVLQQLPRHHQVAHPDARGQPAGDAREDQRARLPALAQERRGRRRGHLADAAEHQHHVVPGEPAAVEVAPGQPLDEGTLELREQRSQLVVQRGQDGQRHPAMLGQAARGSASHCPRHRAPTAGSAQVAAAASTAPTRSAWCTGLRRRNESRNSGGTCSRSIASMRRSPHARASSAWAALPQAW